jgi:DNA-binding transcriptional MocR family regulator
MRGSPIREVQELSLKPGIISFAGGMPAEDLFPIDEFCNASERVLRAHGSRALQYGTTDGVAALREAIAYRASHHGLRVGAQNVLVTTGPSDVITQLNRAKQTADLHTSPLAQSIALDFLQSGFLDKHVEELRLAYAERRDTMLEAMAVSFPTTVTWTTPAGGFFVWVTLPEPLDAATVLIEAIARNVALRARRSVSRRPKRLEYIAAELHAFVAGIDS